jgi:hypothetical protein
MKTTTSQLWSDLASAGIVQGPAPAQTGQTSPWYVKVLLGFSGWLAALFLLGFIGAGFVFIVKNEVAAIITGLLMIGAAYAMLRAASNEFVEHLAMAISLAGQALVGFGIFRLLNSELFGRHTGVSWLLLTLFEIPVMLLIPNFTHRVLTTLIVTFGFSMSLNAFGAGFVFGGIILFIAVWIWLTEFDDPRTLRLKQAIGYGLVFALIPLKGSALFGYHSLVWYMARTRPGAWVQPWMGEALIAVVFVYVVWRLLQRYQQSVTAPLTIATLLAAAIISLASIEAHGITIGITILLLGFAGSNKILQGLGIIALLFFVSSYYYLLDTTLLVKAMILLAVGLILLCVRWALVRLLAAAQEAQHG